MLHEIFRIPFSLLNFLVAVYCGKWITFETRFLMHDTYICTVHILTSVNVGVNDHPTSDSKFPCLYITNMFIYLFKTFHYFLKLIE